MFFILRMIFWMVVVMLMLPAARTTPDGKDPSAHALTAKAVSAVASYCVENPGNCVAGLEAARALTAPIDAAVQHGMKTPGTAAAAQIQVVALPPPRPVIP